jgi:hypothetical protein
VQIKSVRDVLVDADRHRVGGSTWTWRPPHRPVALEQLGRMTMRWPWDR